MVNPQESLDAGILTQFSEFSDISSNSSPSIDNLKTTGLSLKKTGNKIIQFQFGIEESSSSPSFMSPGSPDTTTVVTQPPTPKKMAPVIKHEPAKCSIDFNTENADPQPSKKAKVAKVTCCGRCEEFAKVCADLHADTNPALKVFQYKYHEKNSKYRAIFYHFFKQEAGVVEVPICVKEFARSLYPSPPAK